MEKSIVTKSSIAFIISPRSDVYVSLPDAAKERGWVVETDSSKADVFMYVTDEEMDRDSLSTSFWGQKAWMIKGKIYRYDIIKRESRQLVLSGEYRYFEPPIPYKTASIKGMAWYEPILLTIGLSSAIFAIWTIK